MGDKTNILDQDQLQIIQKDDPGVAVLPITQEQWDETARIIERLNEEERRIPLLKMTQEVIDLITCKNEDPAHQFIHVLENAPIKSVITLWLLNLKTNTRITYARAIQNLIKRTIIPEKKIDGSDFTTGDFNMHLHEAKLDDIKSLVKQENMNIDGWEEATCQLHAAAYISFTAYLNRITQGRFRRALPNPEGSNPTFFEISDQCKTNALTLSEWHRFIDALIEINYRDSLIARCLLQGAKRISEALNIKINQVNWEENIIRFKQSKTGGTVREISITYPVYFMNELKKYREDTKEFRKTDNESSFLFISKKGERVSRFRLNYSFAKASEKAGIKRNNKVLKVTPHVLRATWVTIVKQQGIQDTEIMKVTGHRSIRMILAYDKQSKDQNISKKITLI